MKNTKADESKFILFIDFKSAYNTVNREILYKRLVDKEILNKKEVNFLEYIH